MLITNLLLVLSLFATSVFTTGSSRYQNQQKRGRNGQVRTDQEPAAERSEPLRQPLRHEPASPVSRTSSDEVRLAVDLVVLDALVLHQKTGRAVGDLTRQDFTLLEDGVQQEITNFGQDSLPLSVIFLVDRGGCLDPFSEKVRRATGEALARLKPQDEAALFTFADSTELLAGFTTNRDRIIQALDRVPPHREEAQHCFSDAFYRAAEYMRKAGNPDGRRVIVVITAITTHFDCGRYSTEDARQALLESGSVVCAIIPKTPVQQLENGIMRATTMFGKFKGKTDLKQLTEETGGEILTDKPDVLDRTFGVLMDHLRTRYTLGFVSTNTKRDGQIRKLRLDLKQSSQNPQDRLVVKARRAYIARRR